MKPKEITVSVSLPVQLEKYTTMKPFVSMTCELEEGDVVSECIEMLHVSLIEDWKTAALRELAWYKQYKNDPDKEKAISNLITVQY